MSKTKRFLQTAGLYFVGNVLSKLIIFLLLPLYTINFTPKEYGTYDLIISLLSFIVPITFFQIWDGMFRFTFDKQNLKEKYAIITNSFSVFILGALIYSIIFLCVFKITHFDLAIIIYFYGLIIALQYQYVFIVRALLRNKLFILTGLINTIITSVLNLILILSFDFGIETLYLSAFAGSLVQILLIEFFVKPLKNIQIKSLNLKIQLEMIKFSIPLCFASISYWLLSGYSRIVVLNELGTYYNGLFAIANKFAALITIVVTVFQYAWNELTYMMVKDGNRVTIYSLSIQFIIKIILISTSIVILIIKIIFPYLIHGEFKDAIFLIPLLLIGVGFNSISNFIGTIFMAEKQTKYILTSTVIVGLTNLVFSNYFAEKYGIQGVLVVLCFSFLLLGILRFIKVHRLLNIDFKIFNITFYFIILILTSLIFYNVESLIITFVTIIFLSIILLLNLVGIYKKSNLS